MNEEFAIRLKTVLDQSSIEQTMAQLGKMKDTISQTMSEATSKATSSGTGSFNFDTSGAQEHMAEIALLLDKLDTLEQEYEILSTAKPWAGQQEELLKLAFEIEKVKNRIKSLTKDNGGGMSMFSKTVISVNNGFKDVRRNVGRVVAGLIGVRSLYTSIRKAMSSYLAQNEELQNKLNACWYALGSLFAPALEWIVNLFVKIVAYVDALVKALGFAGINMSKFGKKTGQASKQLAGFDEINNLNSQSGGGGGAGNPFADVDVKPEVITFLQNLMKWLPTIIAGLGLIHFAIKLIRDAMMGTLEPIDAIKRMGIGLAIFGIITALNALYNYLSDPSWFNFGMIFVGIGLAIAGIGIATMNVPLIIAGAITAILGMLASFWPQVSGWIDTAVEWVDERLNAFYDWLIYWFGDIGEQWASSIARYWDLIKSFIQTAKNFLDDLFNGVKKIVDGIVQMFKGDLKGGIQTAIDGIKLILKGLLNVGIDIANGLISAVSNGINRVIDMLNTVHYDVPSWVPFVGGKSFGINIPHVPQYSIPRLASGTNYVPNDMLAQLHQGEAVVPKAFNEDQYNNSEETNDLLRELIDVVGSKEFRAYISQREIGEASLNYQRSKQRIMGGGLV